MRKSGNKVDGWVLNLYLNWLGLAEKVRAKHSDRKSTVSAMGYTRMLGPYRTSHSPLSYPF
ncbi:MAG: hypothetical protein EWV82_17920 [Microcystis aeruginosa Ma_AC_P_19900807_S299]|nr:MAG: hypothetical protein EWV82_17920 [Microcystis aeruginosa Ma_AC_P_19900807_S299]